MCTTRPTGGDHAAQETDTLQLSTEEKLTARAASGFAVQLMTTSGGARLRRGVIHFRPSGWAFVSEGEATEFATADVIGASRTGDRLTLRD